jgi:hypothetical protein
VRGTGAGSQLSSLGNARNLSSPLSLFNRLFVLRSGTLAAALTRQRGGCAMVAGTLLHLVTGAKDL